MNKTNNEDYYSNTFQEIANELKITQPGALYIYTNALNKIRLAIQKTKPTNTNQMPNELIRNLMPRSNAAKCQGMHCKTQNTCLRFLRPAAPYRQTWHESWRKPDPCPDYQPAVQHATPNLETTP